MAEIPTEIRRLADERAAARAIEDFARADAIRDELAAAGWRVIDAADGGSRIEPVPEDRPGVAGDPPDALDEAATVDVSLHWVCEGWPEDIDRAIGAFRRLSGERTLQLVIADATGASADRWGGDVEVVPVPAGAGWAAARNAGLSRSLGEVVIALEPSLEPTGDVLTPIVAALGEPAVGIVGPYGIVTEDLREFVEATAGLCDAIEGYLMAFRREVLRQVGGFDERFRWYRSADIDWSFRVKDAGYRVQVVDVPVVRHAHRIWETTPPDDRARLSRRNFYRFLDRYRDRWDLVEAGRPQGR